MPRSFRGQNIPRPEIDEKIVAALRHHAFDIEIGAGQGLHALQYCQRHPDRKLLAIERTHVKFAQLKGRAAAHPHVQNLSVIQADAIAIFAHFIPANSLGRIFLLYPNPDPKPKHAKRRWHNQPFLGELRTKLKVNGEVTLSMNLAWYAEEALAQFTQTWNFKLLRRREIRHPEPPRTHFEKKYLERGETCYEMVFTKPESSV